MKISIITATFNSSKTVRDTLESIKNQSYIAKIEHLIIDGGSTDNTLEIVNEYNHVSKILSEPDNGIYDAMNKGINLATGEIVGILNSDDFYTNNQVIKRIIEVFQKKETDSIYGDLLYVKKDNPNKIIRKWKAKAYNRSLFLFGWMPPHPTFFVRRKIYIKYGLFNSSMESAADYELMLRFLFKYGISTYYIPMFITKMRTGGKSNKTLLNRIKANREDLRAWKENGLNPKFYTVYLKPLRKLSQFFKR